MKKSSVIRGGISTLALAGLLVNSAFADATSTSTQNVNTVVPSLLDKIAVTYVNAFTGPAVTSLGSMYQASKLDGTTDTTTPLLFENTLGAIYKLTDHIKIGPTFYWQYKVGGVDNLLMGGDSYVKVSHNALITKGAYTLTGEARYYVPITEASRDKRSMGAIRVIQNQNYDIPNTKWSVGVYSFVQKYFYNQYEAGKGFKGTAPWSLRAYVGPSVTYAITDSVQAALLYEATARVRFGKSVFSGWENPNPDGAPSTDIEPSVNWDITKSISLNPYLDIPVSGRVALDTTTINANFIWKLL